MARPDTWMPIYIGSYLADTARLTTEGHGAYLLLLMDYWRNGPLPDDDESLAAIARLPLARWSRYRAILGCLPFFAIRDGKWHQKRADAEREKAVKLIAKRSEAGSKGAKSTWQTHGKANGKHDGKPPDEPMASGQQSQWQTDGPLPSPSPSEKPNPNGLGKNRRKGTTSLAPDWKPDERDCAFAHKRGWDDERIDAEAERFRARNKSRDERYADWNAAWQTWVLNSDKFAARTPNRAGRATADERRHAIFASVSGELGNRGDATGGGGEFGNGFDGGGRGPDADTAENLRGADGSVVRVVAYASQGIVGDVERTACEVSPGRSETRLGSRPENPQVGNPAEDRANGRGRGIGPVVSASAVREINFAEGDHAAGMGQAGSDAEFFDLGSFKRF